MLNKEENCVYMFYNKEKELLYVGITNDISLRLKQHRADKDWWAEVDKIYVSQNMTRNEVHLYEIYYIANMIPKYNKTFDNGGLVRLQIPDIKFSEYIVNTASPIPIIENEKLLVMPKSSICKIEEYIPIRHEKDTDLMWRFRSRDVDFLRNFIGNTEPYVGLNRLEFENIVFRYDLNKLFPPNEQNIIELYGVNYFKQCSSIVENELHFMTYNNGTNRYYNLNIIHIAEILGGFKNKLHSLRFVESIFNLKIITYESSNKLILNNQKLMSNLSMYTQNNNMNIHLLHKLHAKAYDGIYCEMGLESDCILFICNLTDKCDIQRVSKLYPNLLKILDKECIPNYIIKKFQAQNINTDNLNLISIPIYTEDLLSQYFYISSLQFLEDDD